MAKKATAKKFVERRAERRERGKTCVRCGKLFPETRGGVTCSQTCDDAIAACARCGSWFERDDRSVVCPGCEPRVDTVVEITVPSELTEGDR
jgi:DNA-directed RNA polymerase subunit RPC12/RpoP